MGLFDKLRGKKEIKEAKTEFPYADFRRLTRTGKVRARGGEEKGEVRFGVDQRIDELMRLSDNAEAVYKDLSRIADQDGYCFPKAIKELEDNELLMKIVARTSRRGGSSNIYQLRKIEAKEIQKLNRVKS
jgi:hypothetical protein